MHQAIGDLVLRSYGPADAEALLKLIEQVCPEAVKAFKEHRL